MTPPDSHGHLHRFGYNHCHVCGRRRVSLTRNKIEASASELVLVGQNQCMKSGGCTGGPMKSPVVKRSIVIGGHKTSVCLEDAFWSELREIAHSQGATVSNLVAQIDDTRQQGNLSSALRLYVLEHMRSHGPSNPH